MITLRLDSPVPLIDQLVAGLRCAIARGDVAPGDALPTVRQLAADLGVDMNTVSRAYRVLAASGLVATTRGRGTSVTAARDATPVDDEALRARLRAALADARLAGRDADAARALVDAEIDAMWSPPPHDTSREGDPP